MKRRPKGRRGRNESATVEIPVPARLKQQLERRAKRRGISVSEYVMWLVKREDARQARLVTKSLRSMAMHLQRGDRAKFAKAFKATIPPNRDPVFRGLVRAVAADHRGKGGGNGNA